MNYILKTIDTRTLIDEKEYKYIIDQMQAGKDFVLLTSKGLTFKINAIMEIYPERTHDTLEDRKKQQTGILHDGSKTRRSFGQWVDYNSSPDDSGNYSPVRLDPEYYPEVALDCVATESEWQQITKMKENYYKFLGINDRVKRLENKGLQQICE